MTKYILASLMAAIVATALPTSALASGANAKACHGGHHHHHCHHHRK